MLELIVRVIASVAILPALWVVLRDGRRRVAAGGSIGREAATGLVLAALALGWIGYWWLG